MNHILPVGSQETDGVRSVARAAALLRLLARSPGRPQRLSELSADAGLHKVTTRRLLGALVAEGLAELLDRGYVLGPQAWLIGRAAGHRYDLTQLAGPSVERIAATVGDVALLAVQAGNSAVCLARVEGSYPIVSINMKPGMVRPLGVGAHALALLAAHPDARVEEILAETEAERSAFPKLTSKRLREKVRETRRQGFALIDGDIVPGLTGVAVAVLDPWGKPLASLSCVAITARLGPDRRREVADILRREADHLEARLQRGAAKEEAHDPASEPSDATASRR